MPTPFGIVINEVILQWGALPDADSFEITITGVVNSPFTVAGGTYSFDLTLLGLAPGTYDIQIQAISDGVDFTDSKLSEVVQYPVSE